MATLLGKKV